MVLPALILFLSADVTPDKGRLVSRNVFLAVPGLLLVETDGLRHEWGRDDFEPKLTTRGFLRNFFTFPR